MRSWFSWNGQNSLNRGIILETAPEIVRAQERVTQVTVPGRPGDLILLEGDDVYEPYALNMAITVRGAENAQRCWYWLRGAGTLSLSCTPDLVQDARLMNAVNLVRVSRNSGLWSGDLSFWCQPLKRSLHEKMETVTTGTVLINQGDVTARPRIELTGTGTLTATINGRTITITEVTAAQGGVVIDCDAEEIRALLTGDLITQQSTGDFPLLPVGRYALTFTGGSACRIKKGVRWL